MAEYIDRELARQVICGWCEYDTCPGYDYYWDKCDAKRRLDDIPSADVQPIINPYNNHPICPYCGSDLQGVIKDDG